MNNRLGFVLWIALALACGTAQADEIRWAPDIATARKAAMEYKVPVLIHFFGDNCLPCKVLEQNVLSKAEAVATLNKYFICVRVNASQERQTAAEYGVHSWPTDVFLSPDGKTLYQGVCKPNLGEYLGVLQNIAVMNRDRNIMLAAEQTQNANQVTAQMNLYPQPSSAGQPPTAFAGQLPVPGTQPAGNANGPNHYLQSTGTAGQQQLPLSLGPGAGVSSGPLLVQNQPHPVTTAVQATGNQIPGVSKPFTLNQSQGHLPPTHTVAQIPAPNAPQFMNPQTANQPFADPQFATQPFANPQLSNPAASPTPGGYPGIPNVPSPTQPQTPTQMTWNRNQPAVNANAQFLDNPHYASSQPSAVAAMNPASNASQITPGQSPQAATQLANQQLANQQLPMQQSAVQPPVHQPPVASGTQNRIPASTVAFQTRNNTNEQPTGPGTTGGSGPTESRQEIGATGSSGSPQIQTAASSTPGDNLQAAIDGYCPVALKRDGAWLKGKASFAVKHRGRLYHLSSQAAMDEFLVSPDSASPVLSGCDPMVLLNEGKLVDGSIQYGLHEQVSGAILLFTSAESKQAYEQDFDRNTRALDELLRNAGVK